jgi:hypothetical protein
MKNSGIKGSTTVTPLVNLMGVIVPTDWDGAGTYTAIALAADDEQEYHISPDNQPGRSLHRLLRARVKIEGYIDPEAAEGHKKIIFVDSYSILEVEL